MSKTSQKQSTARKPRNNVAAGMIAAGTGKAQVFADRRTKRAKDARNDRVRNWREE